MLKITKTTLHHTVDFAAQELKKYLRMMMPEGGEIEISYGTECRDCLSIGLMKDFGIDDSDTRDDDMDEILYIHTRGECGIIAGNNPRAVLLATYEYLRQNGCRWLMLGKDGEFIPTVASLADVS